MGILEMDFERILGVPFFIVVFTLSCCAARQLSHGLEFSLFTNLCTTLVEPRIKIKQINLESLG